ncbi:MAG: S8 family serine peptidase [Chloroflexota bacterium]
MEHLNDGAPAEERIHWPSRIVAIILFFWVTLLPAVVQLILWSADQLAYATGDGLPRWNWVAATAGSAFLLIVPLLPLAIWWRVPRYRAIFRTWLLAALFGLWVSPLHFAAPLQSYLATGLQITLGLTFAFFFLLWQRFRRQHPGPERPDRPGPATLAALTLAPLLTIPWLILGAPGGPLEVVLDTAAALAFGTAAALLIRHLAASTVAATGGRQGSRARNLLVGGLAAGAALTVMASAFGFHGLQLLLILAVPGLGWAAFTLSSLTGRVRPALVLLAAAAAGPLLMVDSAELAVAGGFLLEGLLRNSFQAAVYSLALSWVSATVVLLWGWRAQMAQDTPADRARTGRLAYYAAASMAWLLAGALFFLVGQPDFHGDRLLVILREQADVSEAIEMEDVAARRRYVYSMLVEHADATQADLRLQLARLGVQHTPYYLVNSVEVSGGPLLRMWLSSQPEVERVLPVPVLRPVPLPATTGPATSAPESLPWNLSLIAADRVWQEFGVRGDGIVVGQADSGVQWDHPELLDSYRGGADAHDYNWFDPWYHTEAPRDPGGHGTHTLGTVLGNTTGVAPDATWFGCSNLAHNLGNPALYLDCLQFMLAPFPLDGDPFRDGDPQRGANVLNNSWGCPEIEGCDADALLPAVRALRAAGTFIVVSAGNSGPQCNSVNSPLAIYDEVLSVGAVTRTRTVTEFSSRGPVTVDGSGRPKPDIMAPGSDIVSAFPGDGYRAWQGTSMAGPHVAGVVALMWSANPALVGNVDLTEQILIESADPDVASPPTCSASGNGPNNTFGYGIVDAYAAVEQALELGGDQ